MRVESCVKAIRPKLAARIAHAGLIHNGNCPEVSLPGARPIEFAARCRSGGLAGVGPNRGATADSDSYGFRHDRSTADAGHQGFNTLSWDGSAAGLSCRVITIPSNANSRRTKSTASSASCEHCAWEAKTSLSIGVADPFLFNSVEGSGVPRQGRGSTGNNSHG